MANVCLSQAQDIVVESEPEDGYARTMLDLVRLWNAATSFGDVREVDLGEDDLDLRVWRGLHQELDEGIAVRRRDGRWSATGITLKHDELVVPDTIPRPDLVPDGCAYRAGRRSGWDGDGIRPYLLYRLYCTEVFEIADDWSNRDFERLWGNLVTDGLLAMPSGAGREDLIRFGGNYYALELRVGNRYRATWMDYFEFTTEVEKQLLAVVRHLFPLFWEARGD